MLCWCGDSSCNTECEAGDRQRETLRIVNMAFGINNGGPSRGVRGGLALPADEAGPAETPGLQASDVPDWSKLELIDITAEELDELNVLEAERRPEDVLALLPKVTMMRVALDSGACEHVASMEDLEGFKVHQNDASKRGECYIAANGDKIPNQGECRVGLKDGNTGSEFDSLFQLAPVSRPLYSVGRICDTGAEVSFTKHKATVRKDGRTIAVFERYNGLYLANLEVKGEADPASTFVRQGATN